MYRATAAFSDGRASTGAVAADLCARRFQTIGLSVSGGRYSFLVHSAYVPAVDAKSALNAKHTASRTKLASHAQRAKDVPVNFS
jgi:hypothetical protein